MTADGTTTNRFIGGGSEHVRSAYLVLLAVLPAGPLSCTGPAFDSPPSETSAKYKLNSQNDAGAAPHSDLKCLADEAVPQKTDYSKPGPYVVGSIDMMFEDSSRPIARTERHSAAPSRQLQTMIYYPASAASSPGTAPPMAAGGPFAMLMYSHGFSSNRDEGALVAKQAASHGYIVVAPNFPLTNTYASDGPDITDSVNQPGDQSFLIDQLVAMSSDSTSMFANAVDESRIGALGVSLGGFTTWLISFHPRLQDPRIKAAMPIAALAYVFSDGFFHTRELPVLVLHGDIDGFVRYEKNARRPLMRAAPNARLLTAVNGTHASFGAQVDGATTRILNGLLAPTANPTNLEGASCAFMGPILQDVWKDAWPETLQALGGPADFIDLDTDAAESTPCANEEYKKPALDGFEQAAIAVSSSVAFFDAYLAKAPETQRDGCRYLLHEMPKSPAVKLE